MSFATNSNSRIPLSFVFPILKSPVVPARWPYASRPTIRTPVSYKDKQIIPGNILDGIFRLLVKVFNCFVILFLDLSINLNDSYILWPCKETYSDDSAGYRHAVLTVKSQQ